MGSPLNPQSLLSVIPLLATGGLGGVASNVTCTDCNRATYALARAYSPSVANNTELYDDLVHQCGEARIILWTTRLRLLHLLLLALRQRL